MATKGEANDVDRHVGRRVFQARQDRGITQRHLAKAIGVTYQQLQKYENGINRIGASRLFRIAEALGVPVPYFFQGIEPSGEALPRGDASVPDALGEMIPDPSVRRAFLGLGRAIAQSKR